VKAKPPDQRKKIIYLRVTETEHKDFVAAAWSKNLLLSQWIRAVLLQKLGRDGNV
jgi:predicted HicB family RNase H-like nuclease